MYYLNPLNNAVPVVIYPQLQKKSSGDPYLKLHDFLQLSIFTILSGFKKPNPTLDIIE